MNTFNFRCRNFILSFLFFSMPVLAFAQSGQEKLVQLSGVIVTGDSLSPVPYTGIMIKSSSRGTVSDYYGFFNCSTRW
ncbi:MAG: hypothetical protein IPJ93_14050 [Bacteroidota bacterium]|nr:MAG: hypothetical protein IPJ93_14050 [Bacteroidota bacterium]